MVVEIKEINQAEGCLDKYSITIFRIGFGNYISSGN
jgi:hypothetical protein